MAPVTCPENLSSSRRVKLEHVQHGLLLEYVNESGLDDGLSDNNKGVVKTKVPLFVFRRRFRRGRFGR